MLFLLVLTIILLSQWNYVVSSFQCVMCVSYRTPSTKLNLKIITYGSFDCKVSPVFFHQLFFLSLEITNRVYVLFDKPFAFIKPRISFPWNLITLYPYRPFFVQFSTGLGLDVKKWRPITNSSVLCITRYFCNWDILSLNWMGNLPSLKCNCKISPSK